MRVDGTSTVGRSMRFALRICVNKSAIGSVIMSLRSHSPTRFNYSRNQAVAGHLAKTNAANAKLAVDGSRPAAQSAAKSDANLVPRTQRRLGRVFLVRIQRRQLTPVFHQLGFSGHQTPRIAFPASRVYVSRPPLLNAYDSRNGIPKDRNNSRASSSLSVVVTNVTSIP